MKKEGGQNRQDEAKKVNLAGSRVSRVCRGMGMPLLFGLLCVALGFAVMSPIAFSLSEQEAQKIQENIEKWRMDAERGNPGAQTAIGGLYEEGIYGWKKNIDEAIKWYRNSAEKGNMFGEYRLALCYFAGKGVEQDIPEAIKLIQSASQKGCLSAQTVLGSSYLTGYGVEKDEELGRKLIRDAAQKGDPTAVEILIGIIRSQTNKGCGD